jgi:hypothetical protein
VRKALPWAFVAALLGGLAASFRHLRSLARLADQRDPIVLLEHPTGDLASALGRAGGASWLRLALLMLPAIALGVLLWKRRGELPLRAPIVVLVLAVTGLWLWQALVDTRVGVRTLCWAAKSGVYDRQTRERALVRGRVLLDRPLGRIVEAAGAGARARCDEAGQILGM